MNRTLNLRQIPALRQFSLDNLAAALAAIPWDEVVGHLASSDMTALQRSLLPTLLAAQRSQNDAHFGRIDPARVNADALKGATTTRSALLSAAVGLVMIAARLVPAPAQAKTEALNE